MPRSKGPRAEWRRSGGPRLKERPANSLPEQQGEGEAKGEALVTAADNAGWLGWLLGFSAWGGAAADCRRHCGGCFVHRRWGRCSATAGHSVLPCVECIPGESETKCSERDLGTGSRTQGAGAGPIPGFGRRGVIEGKDQSNKMRTFSLHVVYLMVISSLSDISLARRSADLYCGACRALVDEIEWEISQVDPEKVIETGSFVLGPDGMPMAIEVPYARSETFLLELLERVCEHMTEYGEQTHPATQRRSYLRVLSRDGVSADLHHTHSSADGIANLKLACEKLAEEYEDEFIEFFSHETSNVKDRLCSKRTDLCDHALHTHHDEL
uniref:protein canopy homolog 2-like n=1 Tax=Pristiophorus japonicus TaxID=55135 RepID=UPI00398F19FE